jgi:hypothetical protein
MNYDLNKAANEEVSREEGAAGEKGSNTSPF